jgi:hypothetical protein
MKKTAGAARFDRRGEMGSFGVRRGWLAAVLLLVVTACDSGGSGELSGDGGADGDAGTDADASTDTDADADSDGDADSDSDTDADSDGDLDGGPGLDGGMDGGARCVDLDSDGWCVPFDCDDGNAAIHPNAVEDQDGGVDDDCDSETDEVPVLEDWDMYLTVDNQFAVYFGTPDATTGTQVGFGSDWPTEYHFTAMGRKHTDYMYVATASDHFVAQGFIGTFTNTTLGKTTNTGDDVWEVFPAGHYAATNPYLTDTDTSSDEWPASLMPTQTQVDTAIAYAEANGLWVTPVGSPGYDNDPSTPFEDTDYTNPWASAAYTHIPIDADWIWHQSETVYEPDNMPSPLEGFNHDEFLVFRVAGSVPGID